MSAIEAFVLGVVQGVTGILPASAETHLWMAWRWVLGAEGAFPSGVALFLRIGTAAAVLTALRDEIGRMARSAPRQLAWLALAAVPPAVFGPRLLFMRDMAVLLPWGGLTLAAFLWGVRRVARAPGAPVPPARTDVNGADALLMGLSQVAAFCPGLSGLALAFGCGVLCGLERGLAWRFALLSTAAALAVEVGWAALAGGLVASDGWTPAAVGAAASFSVGLLLLAPFSEAVCGRSLAPLAAWAALAAALAFAVV